MKKNILKTMTLFLVVFLGLYSCKDKDRVEKPVINLTEVGHNNSMKVKQGEDMHLEASIVAEGLIKRIDVQMHQEAAQGTTINKSFTEGKYVGVKNTTFHEHIEIPISTPLGEYHLHFIVTDKEGQTSMKEAHINVLLRTMK